MAENQLLADLRAQVAELQQGSQPRVEGERGSAADSGSAAEYGSAAHAGSGGGLRAAGDGAPVDPDADAEAVAHAIVLRQLTGQARTRTELARVLQRKNVPQPAADAVLDRMEQVGLVDDAEFAQSWVDSRQRRRHLSSTALRRELRAKGVDAELVDQAVATVEPDDEYAAALELAQRKHSRMAGLERVVIRRRLSGVLARRGFGTGVIVRVLGDVLDAQHDLDEP